MPNKTRTDDLTAAKLRLFAAALTFVAHVPEWRSLLIAIAAHLGLGND